MRPEVSVIITTYNTANYIERAVNSALAQDGVTVEVIIVDDRSNDNTWQTIESLTDPRIKRQQLAVNGGPSAARNAAIDLASGEWLAVLDSDDEFLPGRLQRCLELAKANNADVVLDNLRIYRESDKATMPMFGNLPATLTLAGFIGGNQSFLGGYTLGYLKPIFRADFLKQQQLAYDPSIRIGEDYLLLAQALAEGATCVISPLEGYRYTVREGSISQRLSLAHVERIAACDAKLNARYKLEGDAAHAQKQRTARLKQAFAFTQLVDALKAKNPVGAVKAVISCPSALLQLYRPIATRLKRLKGEHG